MIVPDIVTAIGGKLAAAVDEADLYREWAPPPECSRMVECLWEQRVGRDRELRVIPDGCADVIVSPNGAVAVGLADGPVVHQLAAGSECWGLRLRPEAVATFFNVRADELRNIEVPLDDVVGSARSRVLVDVVMNGVPDTALLLSPPDPIRHALHLLRAMSVDTASAELGFSSRHLRRLVVEHCGLGPKTFQRVARLRRFLEDERPLAQSAASAGYADQAHLTRDVTRLCGLSPAALRAERAR